MAKQIIFEKQFVPEDKTLMAVKINKNGIRLSTGSPTMSVDEVNTWIKQQKIKINEINIDIEVAREAINIFLNQF